MAKVLLVCMGNICRSPTAEGVMRALVEKAGLQEQVEIDSAGTIGYHAGEPPDTRAQQAAARRGYDLSRLRARQVAAADFASFDLILAMDHQNLGHLKQACPPEYRHKLGLFMHYGSAIEPGKRRTGQIGIIPDEVPDPYYSGTDGFELVLDLVENAAKGLIASLAAEKSTT